MSTQDATTLRRGIELLVQLGSDAAVESGGLGVVQLATTIHQDKSQVSRTLQTLAKAGLVDRDPDTQAYRLGWLLYELAGRTGDRRLLATAPEVLAPLVDRFGERGHLSVLRGQEVLTIWTEVPTRPVVQAAGWVGRTTPAWCTSSGRALLADHDVARLRLLFSDSDLDGADRSAAGADAPADLGQLAARVAEVRRRGYSVVEEEFEAGLVGVAAPVRSFTGQIVAAVNISGPTFRLDQRIDEAARAVRAAAATASRLLGTAAQSARTELSAGRAAGVAGG